MNHGDDDRGKKRFGFSFPLSLTAIFSMLKRWFEGIVQETIVLQVSEQLKRIDQRSDLYLKLMQHWSDLVGLIIVSLPDDEPVVLPDKAQLCSQKIRESHAASLGLVGQAAILVEDRRLRNRITYFTERLHKINWSSMSLAERTTKLKEVRRTAEQMADAMRADLRNSTPLGWPRRNKLKPRSSNSQKKLRP